MHFPKFSTRGITFGMVVMACCLLFTPDASIAGFNEQTFLEVLYRMDRPAMESASPERMVDYKDELVAWSDVIKADEKLTREDKVHWLSRIKEKLELMQSVAKDQERYWAGKRVESERQLDQARLDYQRTLRRMPR